MKALAILGVAVAIFGGFTVYIIYDVLHAAAVVVNPLAY